MAEAARALAEPDAAERVADIVLAGVADARMMPPCAAACSTPATSPRAFPRVHFVGIGGVGMSGIAEVLCTLGYQVSGSDIADNAVTRRLAALGVTVHARPCRGQRARRRLRGRVQRDQAPTTRN